jgi:hypothetical protein
MSEATSGTHAQVLHEAAATVARCEHQPVEQAKRAFAETFTRVVQVRNALIADAQRPHDTGAAAARVLVDANALLSLMASIEFPLGGFHHERFGATIAALERLAASLEGFSPSPPGRGSG